MTTKHHENVVYFDIRRLEILCFLWYCNNYWLKMMAIIYFSNKLFFSFAFGMEWVNTFFLFFCFFVFLFLQQYHKEGRCITPMLKVWLKQRYHLDGNKQSTDRQKTGGIWTWKDTVWGLFRLCTSQFCDRLHAALI